MNSGTTDILFSVGLHVVDGFVIAQGGRSSD